MHNPRIVVRAYLSYSSPDAVEDASTHKAAVILGHSAPYVADEANHGRCQKHRASAERCLHWYPILSQENVLQ
jgi:hypothetical protein